MTEAERDEDFTTLIHHSDKRKPHGCLPLNMLLIGIPFIAAFLFIEVKMPSAPQESGEGNIYQKSSPFFYSHTQTTSPAPFRLPNFADPAQIESFEPELGISRKPKLDKVPQLSPFEVKRSSAILSKEDLLELPEIPEADTPMQEGDAQDVTP